MNTKIRVSTYVNSKIMRIVGLKPFKHFIVLLQTVNAVTASRLALFLYLLLMRQLSILSVLLFGFVGVFAQAGQTSTDIGTVYKKEYYGGLMLHTQGYALNFRMGNFVTVDHRNLWSLELSGMKHAKEFKSYNPSQDRTKSFVYGKQNSLTIIRPLFGREKVVYQKLAKRGVQVSRVWMVGPDIGVVKPIYYLVESSVVGEGQERLVKFNEGYDISVISGKGPTSRGLEESDINIGLHLKYGYNFEYAPTERGVKSLEVGLNFDAFSKPVTIMAFENDQQFFLTLYANFFFGRKFLR